MVARIRPLDAILLAVGTLVGLLALGAAWQVAMTSRDRHRFPPPGQLWDIGGRSMHLICAGEGAPTVVLEAGGTHGSDEYARVLPALARHTRVCASDRAGMGWSDPSPEPLTADRLAEDLHRLLTAAAVPPPYILVAASGGGVTAELYAATHPERVAGMVLLDALDARMSLTLEPLLGAHMEHRACLAPWLARVGLMRWLDPLGRIEELPDDEEELGLALASRTSTWDAVCSLVRSREASTARVLAAPPLCPALVRVVLAHEHPEGLTGGGIELDLLATPLWQVEQERMGQPPGSYEIARGSGHHVATDRPDLVIERTVGLVDLWRRGELDGCAAR